MEKHDVDYCGYFFMFDSFRYVQWFEPNEKTNNERNEKTNDENGKNINATVNLQSCTNKSIYKNRKSETIQQSENVQNDEIQ